MIRSKILDGLQIKQLKIEHLPDKLIIFAHNYENGSPCIPAYLKCKVESIPRVNNAT